MIFRCFAILFPSCFFIQMFVNFISLDQMPVVVVILQIVEKCYLQMSETKLHFIFAAPLYVRVKL